MAKPSLEHKVAIYVRLAVLGWSAGLLTMSYLQGPRGDVTFIASIFTASLASFGVERSASGGSVDVRPTRTASRRKPPTTKP